MPRSRGLTAEQKLAAEKARREEAERHQKERIARLINMARAEMGMNQKALAEAAGMCPSTFANKLTGRRPWEVPELIRVADILRMEPMTRNALLGGKEKCRYERGFAPAV